MVREDLEETNSGIKKKGDIEEVAEFAREIEKGLEKQVSGESIEEFNGWRPRENEQKEDFEKKTVEKASISRRKVEEDSSGLKDFSEAGKDFVEASKKTVKRENPGKEIKKGSKKAVRPVYSKSLKLARGIEEEIYSKMMVKFNPYFFDAKEFSADLRANKDGSYSMQVNVPDKQHRDKLKEEMRKQE